MIRRWLPLVAVFALVAAPGCRKRAATADDCRAIVDRLIDIELVESGFHDPALAARWRQNLNQQLAAQIASCQGKRVRADLPSCLAQAHTQEEITHRCLK